MYAKYDASIPCSYLETDLSAETEHFDHAQAHADVHRGYRISSPLLRKDALKIRIMGDNRKAVKVNGGVFLCCPFPTRCLG